MEDNNTMYKIKQKFTIEYTLDLGEISKEEFEELGFNSNKNIADVLEYNLKNIKEDILKEYHKDNQIIKFNTLHTLLEIDNGNFISNISNTLNLEEEKPC